MDILERLEELRGADFYGNYLRARDAVLEMRKVPLDRIPAEARPSDYWSEELERFLYMFDASPFIVQKLRHHCYHITGIQVYSYRTGADRKEGPKYAEKLRILRELDAGDLFVPESPKLGGFGYEIDGQLVNIDTLKFYECMLAMDRGGALTSLRRSSERAVVVEIGSGWGGLAYVFKTLFPNTTMVLVDLPELFLFSATYLTSLFPGAKVAFVTEPGEQPPGAWSDYDFVFVPNSLFHGIQPERLDLAINTVSFQEMTGEQVRSYVTRVAALDCPQIYSLNRKRSLYATQLDDLYGIIGEAYWVNDIAMLDVPYTKLDVGPMRDKGRKDKAPKGKAGKVGSEKAEKAAAAPGEPGTAAKDELRYRHVVAWKKYGRP